MKTKQGVPYCVAADTEEMPGKVVAVHVVLDEIVLNDGDRMRVDLNEHPLYKHLYEYCVRNPPLHPVAPNVPGL